MLLQETFIALACCALVANASGWHHSKRRVNGGPAMQVQDRLPQILETRTLPVRDLYYTHGDTDWISFTFTKEQRQKPHTVYSSTEYLITEIIKILQERGFDTRNKTGAAVSQALRQVQADLGEKLVPRVVHYRGTWYSNSNRTLFCLQTVEKFFGVPVTTKCLLIHDGKISQVHSFSRLSDCCDIGFGYGGSLTPGQRKTMDKFWPKNPKYYDTRNIRWKDKRNPNAYRSLNLEALREYFHGANGLEKYYLCAAVRGFGNHEHGYAGRGASKKSKKKRDRSAWRRRLLLTTVEC